jgi:hypothetical protein
MTVKDLTRVFNRLKPETVVMSWDAEGVWAPVTGFVSDSATVKLFTDKHVANDHGLSLVDLLFSIQETSENEG